MKIKDGFMLSDVAGTPVVVPLGANTSFHNMIKLNETARFLWELLQKETTRESLAAAMMETYEISEEVALRDLDVFLAALEKFGALE